MSLRRTPTLTSAMLAANRRNARKSTGPRSERGKRRVRFNSLKHGLRCGSFRESLVRSGESTDLVDRNFLFLILFLLPQKRSEVHRIEDFVRLLWSVSHWGRRHEVSAAGPDRLAKKLATDFQLQALLNAHQHTIAEFERRRRSAPPDLSLQPGDGREPSQSLNEQELLRRTGPILLPGLAPPKLPAKPRLVHSRWERRTADIRLHTADGALHSLIKNKRAKRESDLESVTSIFRLYHPEEAGRP